MSEQSRRTDRHKPSQPGGHSTWGSGSWCSTALKKNWEAAAAAWEGRRGRFYSKGLLSTYCVQGSVLSTRGAWGHDAEEGSSLQESMFWITRGSVRLVKHLYLYLNGKLTLGRFESRGFSFFVFLSLLTSLKDWWRNRIDLRGGSWMLGD